MTKSLRVRKQEVVRKAIYDAAIDLFFVKGFNETTIDEIVEAAGMSQRSFFRYFTAKSDVLAYHIVTSADILISEINACPPDLSPLEVIRKVAAADVQHAAMQIQTPKIMQIAAKSVAARQAHKTGMVEVEDRLSEAFAARTKSSSKYNLKPRMMAIMTLAIVDLTLSSWFTGESKDCMSTYNNVFAELSRLFSKDNGPSVPSAKSTMKRQRF